MALIWLKYLRSISTVFVLVIQLYLDDIIVEIKY